MNFSIENTKEMIECIILYGRVVSVFLIGPGGWVQLNLIVDPVGPDNLCMDIFR